MNVTVAIVHHDVLQLTPFLPLLSGRVNFDGFISLSASGSA